MRLRIILLQGFICFGFILFLLIFLIILIERIHLSSSSVINIIENSNLTLKSSRSTNIGSLNFERRLNCNLNQTNNCHQLNKSLIITFWCQRSMRRWLSLNLLLKYPEESYDYLIMIYDNSTWINHPAFTKAIWITVSQQMRYWFVKRFVSPHLIKSYHYIWIIDDDVKFDFNPQIYQCVIEQYHILLSSPARLTGAISYFITRISPHYTEKIGRWTDFVETGPLVIFHSSALICLWNYISEKVSSGYGLDLIWCQILHQKCFPQQSLFQVCAILDSFAVDHHTDEINSQDLGTAELSAYQNYYANYQTKRIVLGAIANDSTVFDMCTQKYSNN